MIVVSDASPVNVLVRIGHIGVLPQLFGHVLVPPAVASELSHAKTPDVVRAWLASRPEWMEIRSPSRIDPTLGMDDPGEREAISLALELKADLLLADDKKARRAANQLGIVTTGAVGVLELSAARGLLELREAFQRVRETNFSVSDAILESALARDTARKRQP
jgi:predicted nucleic acid-binding protein